MEKDIQLLKECLETRSPILLLGAGFSLDAKGKSGRNLSLGRGLCQDLYKSVLLPQKASLSGEDLDSAEFYQGKGKLKELCDVIRNNQLIDKRNAFFQENFSVSSFDGAEYYSFLTEHNWRYIFTLNIDDLVEKIYAAQGKKITKWLSSSNHYKEDPSQTILIKLHGDVYDPSTYVFDSTEYRKLNGSDCWMLRKFSHLYVCHDLVIVGTQFQEDDIEIALENAFEHGCDNSEFHYFFISPNSFSDKVAKKISERSHFHHIQWSAQQFLEFLKNDISEPSEALHDLRSQGVLFWNDEIESAQAQREDWKLYHGAPSEPKDFYFSVDIPRKHEQEEFKSFINQHRFGYVEIRGKTYVGKTCFVKRALTIAMSQGYNCFYIPRTDLQYIQIVDHYLSTLTSGSVLFCFENAGNLYGPIISMAKRYQDSLNKLIIVVTSSDMTKESYSYLFESSPFLEIPMTEHVNRELGNSIYQKLSEKSQLGKLLSYADRRKDIISFMRKRNDLIDVLYFAHHGKSFARFFSDWMDAKSESKQLPVFQAITLIVSVGVPCIVTSDLPLVAQSIGNFNFNCSNFIQEFGDFCFIDGGFLYLRCSRLFNDALLTQFDFESRKRLIKNLIQKLSADLVEGEISSRNEMFKHLSRASSLEKIVGLSTDIALKTLIELKDLCKHLSYYWVQVGILYRNLEQYEDAENAFEYAKKAHGRDTYQISHATAKNYMEWGVWSIENTPSQAAYLFDEGAKGMLNLMLIWRYPDAICFSSHAYIDMNIKYYLRLGSSPDAETWQVMNTCMEKLIANSNSQDALLNKTLAEMSNFADKYNLGFQRESDFRQAILGKSIRFSGGFNEIDISMLPEYER